MAARREEAPDVQEALRQLEESVVELRAETGAEALELRARVRALEKRLDQLAKAPPEPQAARPKRKKAERPKQRRAESPEAAPRRAKPKPAS